MKKTMLMGLLIPALAFSAADDMADQYFAKKKLKLSSQEKTALSIGKKWQTGSATSKPFAARDGSIQFVYGSGQTKIVCSVLQVCDVALQAGESVNNINTGDPRFTVEPAVTGTGEGARIHLLIKALDVGLDSSLVVATDRRTYHFRLRSSRSNFMPYVSFTYPEETEAQWKVMAAKKAQAREDNTIPATGEYLGNLDFNYCITGNARWKPARVYNDGRKTIIEMPHVMRQSEAPALLVVRSAKGLFKKEETAMVNYRVKGNRYIVDSVFHDAILIAGAGRNQQRVEIKRTAS